MANITTIDNTSSIERLVIMVLELVVTFLDVVVILHLPMSIEITLLNVPKCFPSCIPLPPAHACNDNCLLLLLNKMVG
jgi:hypothetical protein